MFTVDEPTADAIRRAWQEGGELSGMVEFKRHFPLISDNASAGSCMRAILGWAPQLPEEQPTSRKKRRVSRTTKA